MSRDRRIGRFRISMRLIERFDTDVKRVMGQCIITRADYLFSCDAIEYVAISEHFRELDEGEIAPEYAWIFTSDGGMTCTELPW